MATAASRRARHVLAAIGWLLLALPAWAATAPAATKASTAQPNVHVLPTPFLIPGLNRQRTVRIYLPPGYQHATRSYPVLYMHDGQNLFDDATAYAGEWGVDEALNELAKSRALRLIVVGIDNGGAERIHELNPWDNRTRPDRRHTAIMGSSMGGLISTFAVSRYPEVFGSAAVFSPAYWLAPQVFTATQAHPPPPGERIYFYAGGSESETMLPDLRRMVEVLRHAGLPARDLEVEVNPVGRHNEAAWRAEFPCAVMWLFRRQ